MLLFRGIDILWWQWNRNVTFVKIFFLFPHKNQSDHKIAYEHTLDYIISCRFNLHFLVN